MKSFIKNLKNSKSGAAATEYVLLLALLGAGVVAAVTVFGTGLNTAFTNLNTATAAEADGSF